MLINEILLEYDIYKRDYSEILNDLFKNKLKGKNTIGNKRDFINLLKNNTTSLYLGQDLLVIAENKGELAITSYDYLHTFIDEVIAAREDVVNSEFFGLNTLQILQRLVKTDRIIYMSDKNILKLWMNKNMLDKLYRQLTISSNSKRLNNALRKAEEIVLVYTEFEDGFRVPHFKIIYEEELNLPVISYVSDYTERNQPKYQKELISLDELEELVKVYKYKYPITVKYILSRKSNRISHLPPAIHESVWEKFIDLKDFEKSNVSA